MHFVKSCSIIHSLPPLLCNDISEGKIYERRTQEQLESAPLSAASCKHNTSRDYWGATRDIWSWLGPVWTRLNVLKPAPPERVRTNHFLV